MTLFPYRELAYYLFGLKAGFWILAHGALKDINFVTIWRKHPLAGTFARFEENAQGALGILNPCLSIACNQSCQGLKMNFPASYSGTHSVRDIWRFDHERDQCLKQTLKA